MIYIFRKEMKKWHTVLWIVFAALAISGASLFFLRTPGGRDVKVVTVNGQAVRLAQFRRILATTQQRLHALKEYARIFGISESLFLKNYYGSANPHDIALDTSIKELLIDQISSPFDIHIGSKYFEEEFVKSLPQGIVDERGSVNMNAYGHHLRSMATTAHEYEKSKEDDFRRQLIRRFIGISNYASRYEQRDKFMSQYAQKSFNVVVFPYDHFLEESKKNIPDKKTLLKFFNEHKEEYRVPEKRKAIYWEISTDDYAEKITLDDKTITDYYNKNKSSMFRIPPKIRVRHIFFEFPSVKHKTDEEAFKAAQSVYEEVKLKPGKFADFAKIYSLDEKTATNGGLTSFFKRGTHDPAFEKAAFRLQEENSLSGIVKAAQGYEIIQLEQRIKASAKPLEKVKDEIIKTLKAKRALSKLKSELEVVLHKAKTDPQVLKQFAKKNNIEQQETEKLDKSMIEGQENINMLAKKLFSVHSQQSKYGYFYDNGKYVIYQHTQTQQSFIQKFDDFQEKILDHYYTIKAKDLIKKAVKAARNTVFNKKTTLEKYAKDHGLTFVQSQSISSNETIPDLSETGGLLKKMFSTLSDPSQLLQYRHKKQFYVAQLQNIQLPDIKLFDATKLSEKSTDDKFQNSHLQTGAFIASLQRNAKIEVNKNVLRGRQR